MPRNILILQGHPDSTSRHLCHALADAYVAGAQAHGHEIHTLQIADLEFPLLRAKTEFETEAPPPAIQDAQSAIAAADHLVLVYPLWLGTMPALVKAFLEQVLRPGFAYRMDSAGSGRWHKALKGKSARIVITMGMPAVIYRWYFRAHSLKSLERNVLGFVGIGPIGETLIGTVEGLSDKRRQRWLDRMRRLGARGG